MAITWALKSSRPQASNQIAAQRPTIRPSPVHCRWPPDPRKSGDRTSLAGDIARERLREAFLLSAQPVHPLSVAGTAARRRGIHTMQGRTPPALPLRCEGRTLRDRTDAQAIALRIVQRASIDRRAAIAAEPEGVKAFVAAFRRLQKVFGVPLRSTKCSAGAWVNTKGRAGERLAIGAVADVEPIGIDLRLEGDLAAMAVSVDLHPSCPAIVRAP